MDIQRHLGNEPVVARPRARPTDSRNWFVGTKIAVAATSAVAAALVIGLGVSTWLFINERADRRRAVDAEQRAETVSQFLKDMLKGVNPIVALGRDTTLLRDILDKNCGPRRQGTHKSAGGRGGIAERDRKRRTTNLETTARPREMHREALRLRKSVFGETNVFVAASLYDLGNDLTEREKSQQKRKARIARRWRCGEYCSATRLQK